MKIMMPCSECFFNSEFLKSDAGTISTEKVLANYDDELCELKCSQGHITYMRVQNDKYELLFDAAIIALHDGYYRESVLNVSSCLESFYEYMIRAFLYIYKKQKMSDIDKFYNRIKSRSECREGVFHALCEVYLSEEYFLDDVSRNIRNKTIHNGYFPKEEETLNYIKTVYIIIYECMKKFKESINTLEYVDFGFALQQKISNKYDKFYANMAIATILGDSITGNFEKDIENFKQRSSYYYNKEI